MKSLLIPVDFSKTTQATLQYLVEFSHDYQVEEIIMVRVHHVPALSQLFPSPDMQLLSLEEIEDTRRLDEIKFNILADEFISRVNEGTQVRRIYSTEKLLPFLSFLIETRQPELIVVGHSKNNNDSESSLNEYLIDISKLAVTPVLLIPFGTPYKKVQRVLLPTSFENLNKLGSFKLLCKSQTWLSADIQVLNVDDVHQHNDSETFDGQILQRYLENYNYQINYSYGKDVVNEILIFAEENNIHLILALPGKHNFLFKLTHKSVTKSFALDSPFPVLLLK
jgi:hypothetical protein